MRTAINFLVFQLEWFLCVLHAQPFFQYGFVVAMALFVFMLQINFSKSMLIPVVIVMACVGVMNDLLLRKAGILIFSEVSWLVVLWCCFSGWFYQATALHKHYFLIPIFFMVFGPLSYVAGSHLNALQIGFLHSFDKAVFCLDWLFLGVFFILMAKVPSFLKTLSYPDRGRGNP